MCENVVPGSGKSVSKISSRSSEADRHNQVLPVPLDERVSARVEPRGRSLQAQPTRGGLPGRGAI